MNIRSTFHVAPALLALLLSACSGSSTDTPGLGAFGGVASGGVASGGASGGGMPSSAGQSPGGVTSSAGMAGMAPVGGAATAGAGGAAAGASGSGMGGSAGAGGSSGGAGGSAGGGSTTDPAIKVVMYLPNWAGTFSSWATKIDFTKMTHLDLAFGTIKGGNDWDLGASDADVKAIAAAAHAKSCKVLVSIGGADDDIGIINAYGNPSNIDPMVNNLDAFITRLDLDGVDVDLERGPNLKASTNFPMFLSKLIAKLRPQGRVVSTALAQYIIEDTGDDAATTAAWLNTYDFINLMIYTNNMSTYTNELNWWTTKRNIPKNKLTWGVDFGGNTSADMIKQLTIASKAYGGIMAWELSQKAAPPLWMAVQQSL